MFCNNCGNKLSNGEAFCGKCGKPIQNNQIYQNTSIQDTKKVSFWRYYLKLIIVAAIISFITIIISIAIKDNGSAKALTIVNIIKIWLPIGILVAGAIPVALYTKMRKNNTSNRELVISLIVIGIFSAMLLIEVFTTKKMYCSTDKGQLVIFYTDKGIVGNLSVGFDFNEEEVNKLFKQYGKDEFMNAFKIGFTSVHGGNCEY